MCGSASLSPITSDGPRVSLLDPVVSNELCTAHRARISWCIVFSPPFLGGNTPPQTLFPFAQVYPEVSLKNAALLSLLLVFANVAVRAQGNPVPFIYQPLSPVSVNPGHAGFTLRVHGTGFRSGAVVRWNVQSLKTTFLSSSALRANVPATAVAKPGTASVTVVNPGR